MLFNSTDFFIFFPVVVTLYFLTPFNRRWLILLLASYYFYAAWKPAYTLILILSTLLDYACGRAMGRYSNEEKHKRKPYLYFSLLSNLFTLGLFKYYNFFNDSARQVAQVLNMAYAVPAFELLLPMGISFYTFQTMSYSIDVYHGRIKAERHLGVFALFVSFFPQLVAGPIERAGNSIGEALYILQSSVSGIGNIRQVLVGADLHHLLFMDQGFKVFAVSVVSILIMETVHLIQRQGSVSQLISRRPAVVRWTIYYSAIVAALLFGQFGHQEFIYFNSKRQEL